MKKGVTKDTLKAQIAKLKKRADIEVAESGGTKLLSETESYKLFEKIKGNLAIPLIAVLNDDQLDKLFKKVNESEESIAKIIQEAFLVQLELYEAKISCNPLMLASLFSTLAGFTGTLWNADSLHRKVLAMPEAGTDARTISLLWKMSSEKDNVIRLAKGSVPSMLKQLSNHSIDLIADAGGYFKEGSNQEIARLAAAEYKKPVVFYNSKNEQTVTDGLNEKNVRERNLAPDARLTFLDQSHTTGSDVPQKVDAVGVVSIGRSMLLRDLLQAVWRLRGLEKGQEVRFLIDNEVEEILRQQLGLKAEQKITFREILRFVIENQCQQQGTDNFKAFKQEIWAIPQMLLISTLLNPDISVIDKKKAFTTLATLWIKPAQKSPRELYGNFAVERPSELVIREEANSCKTYLESIAKNVSFDLDSAFKEIDALAETTIKKVHPFVISPLSDDAATVEVEEETALQTELQVQTQVARDDLSVVLDSKRTYNYNLSYKDTVTKQDLDQYSLDYKYSMEHYFEKQPELARYAKLFDGITFSINVLEWQKGEQDPQNMQLLGNFRTPIHHLVVSGDDVCIFAQNDGRAVDAKDYYNLTLGFKDPKRKPSEKALEKIVKIKFLNGETIYSKKELAFLEKWIAENNPTEMREFFQSIILNGQPNKATSFQASSLDRLFAKLIAVEE